MRSYFEGDADIYFRYEITTNATIYSRCDIYVISQLGTSGLDSIVLTTEIVGLKELQTNRLRLG
jgi:hypothetical protein